MNKQSPDFLETWALELCINRNIKGRQADRLLNLQKDGPDLKIQIEEFLSGECTRQHSYGPFKAREHPSTQKGSETPEVTYVMLIWVGGLGGGSPPTRIEDARQRVPRF